MKSKKIDIGCGTVKGDGYIGVDRSEVSNADVIHDVLYGLPFNSNYADEVKAYSILEHFDNDDFIRLMWEIWRVLKPDGLLDVIVPTCPGNPAFKDPTHKMFFTRDTFTYFGEDSLRRHQYCLPRFKIIGEKDREKGTIRIKLQALKKEGEQTYYKSVRGEDEST